MTNTFRMLLVCLSVINCQLLKSQCMMVPVSLSELCNASGQVVEGHLSLVTTFIHTDRNVYSLYRLRAVSILKGYRIDTLYIVSLGGQLGNRITEVNPSDGLKDAYGVFFLRKTVKTNPGFNALQQFELVAGAQGRIWIQQGRVDDIFGRYTIYEVLKTKLFDITRTWIQAGSAKPLETIMSRKRATPTISSFTPTTRTAGTDSTITITGTNFNPSRGSGFVEFRNADAGGASFLRPLATDYVSWSNTQIVVKVPTSAGTGTIRVFNSDPDSVLSSASLIVPYNLINVTYDPGTGDRHYPTRIPGFASGALLFTFNTRFSDSSRAKRDFVRSMSNWRCKSLINWDTATSTSSGTSPAYDGENLVLWDFNSALPLGVLGVAISNYNGCISGGNIFFWVDDLDVIFNDIPYTGYTWEFGTGVPSSTQFDFESVATHELGHGHQLGHVIDANKVMHYSIGPNQKKATISTADSFGAANMMARNVSSVCAQPAMTALTSTSCSLVALPVDWVDLAGKNTSVSIMLDWKVYHEYGLDEYIVMRSLDGLNFERIGAVKASNRDYAQIISYGFEDRNLYAVRNGAYYRIISMDHDGKRQGSNLVYVDADYKAYFFTRNMQQQIHIISSLDIEKGEVKIYNGMGQEIPYNRQDGHLVLSGVSAGVYFVVYEAQDSYITQKILVN